MRMRVDEKTAEAAVLGGSFLGGGGGGDVERGLSTARTALELGDVYIVDIDEVSRETCIVTASIVGAPASREKYLRPSHMIRSLELFIEYSGLDVGGIISSENGGESTTNGWVPAAVLGIPVVDAPADGRAHPTGVMGSMGLHRVKDYVSIQAAVGGDREAGTYVEVFARGSLYRVDRIVREASVQAGGLVAVTRNPVSPDYVRENAAVGALTRAIEIGRVVQRYLGDPERLVEEVLRVFGGGGVAVRGVVEDISLETRGGYDIGRVLVRGAGGLYEITFWNEYMTLEGPGGVRIATFPDLIVTIDTRTSLPVSSASLRRGEEVVVVYVPRDLVPLGAGVRDPEILREVERVVGKKIVGL